MQILVNVEGESLYLLSEGALLWPAEQTLVIADIHLGKAATFLQNGLLLPELAQKQDFENLERLGQREGVRNLIILGDLVHTFAGLTSSLIEEFARVAGLFQGEVRLVAGNHDQALVRQWPRAWGGISVVEDWAHGPFQFHHEQLLRNSIESKFIWSGHLHPTVLLKNATDRIRLKTFVIAQRHGVLPAFSQLAGGFDVSVDSETRLFPIAENRIFSLGEF